jgi:hypothetical protein
MNCSDFLKPRHNIHLPKHEGAQWLDSLTPKNAIVYLKVF